MAKKRKTGSSINSLEKAISSIEKQFGKGSIVSLTGDKIQDVDVISTGSLIVDKALGVGGIPRGRITEIYGAESSGKTTLATQTAANAQREGLKVVYIDVEQAFDPSYASALGVDLDQLIFAQPDSAEQALEMVDRFVSSGEVGLVVVDSVAALAPRAELEGDMGDAHVGLVPRLMGQACRKITAKARTTNTALIFINQIREKIGIMFGSPETTPGGRALKFYASVRIDMRRIGALKSGQDIIGNRTKIKINKNKLAPPYQTVEVDLVYGEGIPLINELIDLGVAFDLVVKSGSFYEYQGEKVQGRENFRFHLQSSPEYLAQLKEEVIARLYG